MAAISTAVFGLLEAGDEVVCCAAIYGGTFHLLTSLALTLRGDGTVRLARRVPCAGRRSSGRKTKMVWFESPINPTLRVIDVAAVAAACRAAGVLSVMDNTFASPLNQPVLAMGVDLSMQSVTKYLNGHSDVTGGVLSGRAGAHRPARQDAPAARRHPRPAAGLRPRSRPEDADAARGPAQRDRAWPSPQALEGHPALAAVHYPGLASHPDHAIAGPR